MISPIWQAVEVIQRVHGITQIKEKPVLCNFCGEEIDPFDYDAVEFTGTLYGLSHTERICGCCQRDPDSKGCIEKVKNLKKSFINR